MSEVKGSWKGLKAGGCFNYGSWRFNPQFTLKLDKKAKVDVTLEQQGTDYSIGVYILPSSGNGKRLLIDGAEAVIAKSSFKSKSTATVSAELNAGEYLVMPCTFDPNKEGDFVLKSSAGTLKRLSRSKDWKESVQQGEWKGSTAGGCKNHKTFKCNPQLPFSVSEKGKVVVSLFQNAKETFDPLGWYIFKTEKNKPVERFKSSDIVAKCSFSSDTDATAECELEAGDYAIIPCTFNPEKEVAFTVALFSTCGAKFLADSDGESGEDKGNAASSEAETLRQQLLQEKKDHMKTIAKNSELISQIEEMRKSMQQLQDQVKALQSGAGVSGVLPSQSEQLKKFLAEIEGSATDKEKVLSLTKKARALIEEETTKQAETQTESATGDTGVYKITTTVQQGKEVAIFGEWKGQTAGGCFNHSTWRNNPQVFIKSTTNQSITASITLTQDDSGKPTNIGFYIIRTDITRGRRLFAVDPDEDVLAKVKFTSSKSVRLDVTLPASKYPFVILPCTFDANVEKRWTLTISADHEITASLDGKEYAWQQAFAEGQWTQETAGGCKNHASFYQNPQYLLTVPAKAEIHIMLTQSEFEDFDPISVYLVKAGAAKTKLPKISNEDIIEKGKFADPNEVIVSKSVDAGCYVIIPCTFDPKKLASFKLHVFTTIEGVQLSELSDAEEISVTGEWKGVTAGGCLNEPSKFRHNVQYKLTLTRDTNLHLRLRQTREQLTSIGFYILKGSDKKKLRVSQKDILHKSSFTKARDVTLDVLLHAGGSPYIIVPCTFNPGEEGEYKFSIFAKDPNVNLSEVVTLEPVPVSYTELTVNGAWTEISAGGCLNHTTWVNNPQFVFKTDKKTEVIAFLEIPKQENFSSIGFYVTATPTETSTKLEMKSKDIIKKAAFRKATEVSVRMVVEAGSYNIIPATFKPGYLSPFTLTLYSDNLEGSSLQPVDRADITFKGKWEDHNAGGSTNNLDKWRTNPRYYLFVKKPVKLAAVLVQSPGKQFEDENFQPIGFLITKSDGHGNPRTAKPTDLIARAGYEPERDVSAIFDVEPSVDPYLLIPSTFDPDVKLTYQVTLLVDPQYREFVEFSDAPPTISKEEYEEQFKAEALLAKLQKSINTAALATNEVSNLVESAGLSALAHPVAQLLQAVTKIQGVLNALKAAQLINSDEELAKLAPQLALSFGPPPAAPSAGGAAPPPPPPPAGGAPPPPPPAVKEEPVKSTSYEYSGSNELLEIIRKGRAQLKSAAERKLKEKPPEKDAFCAFNIALITQRRAAIEGEDEEDNDDSDWDD